MSQDDDIDENGNPIDPNTEEQQEEEGGHKYAGVISWVKGPKTSTSP